MPMICGRATTRQFLIPNITENNPPEKKRKKDAAKPQAGDVRVSAMKTTGRVALDMPLWTEPVRRSDGGVRGKSTILVVPLCLPGLRARGSPFGGFGGGGV